jgi:hypothetical protein
MIHARPTLSNTTGNMITGSHSDDQVNPGPKSATPSAASVSEMKK